MKHPRFVFNPVMIQISYRGDVHKANWAAACMNGFSHKMLEANMPNDIASTIWSVNCTTHGVDKS
jgi:hypothetical protein